MALRVGFIGTGKKQKPSGTGYAMAWRHADAYNRLGDRCELVACADIVQKNADDFAEATGTKKTYLDYYKMLAEESLDIVSISTWPHLHAEMTIACCEAGVRAVHCEKPMALTWGESRAMAASADKHGVKLTFNHQRRFGKPMQKAVDLLAADTIGKLVDMQSYISNLYDMGTHWIDMLSLFNGDVPAKWVIAQVDRRDRVEFFGAPVDNGSVAHIEYQNGVRAQLLGAPGREGDPAWRLIGERGVIEIGRGDVMLRYRVDGSDWETVDTEGDNLHSAGDGVSYIDRAIEEVVTCCETGEESTLSARRALIATEIIFACYESSRRRGRIDLPLDIDDNPLVALNAQEDAKK